jgi:hypothetical protein
VRALHGVDAHPFFLAPIPVGLLSAADGLSAITFVISIVMGCFESRWFKRFK